MGTKTAIVTGASSGIGLALSQAFLDRGYVVIANARTQSRLRRFKARSARPTASSRSKGTSADPKSASVCSR